MTAAAADDDRPPAGLPVIAAAGTRPARSSAPARSRRTSAQLSLRDHRVDQHDHRRYIEPIRVVPALPGGRARARTRWRSRSTAATGWSNGSSANSAIARSRDRGSSAREAEDLFDDLVRGAPPGAMGLDAPTVLVTRRPQARARRRRARSSASGTSTRARTSTGRSSKAWPTRCARARSSRRSAQRCRSARCASRAAAARAPRRPAHRRRLRPARRRAPTRTRRAGSVRPSTPRSAWASTPSFATAASAMVEGGGVARPGPRRHRLYEDLYRGVYLPMYGKLKPLYAAIRRITGYPPS